MGLRTGMLSTVSEVVAGSAAWLGRGLSCVCAQRRESDARPSFDLTPSQEECLLRLQNRIDVAYDSSIPEHRFLFVFDLKEALKALWKVAFPEEKLYGLISEQWKEMGWQGKDPSTDFRGGGFISLENLLYFARNFPICPLSSLFLWENAMSNFLSICMHAGSMRVIKFEWWVPQLNLIYIEVNDEEFLKYFDIRLYIFGIVWLNGGRHNSV
ncbi:uncharacterized protein LOC107845892 isoform X1 [Capsicum annuum]|uniref:uncharacterized protein LOC107845892 isoform X1 n=1 Tax=Capsicum annuum TaxID=4072 RepID=UPI001FB0E6F4|nr:uncharacterized protein LOC107845892 isoform X1 [Capsicum annuum]